MHACYWFIGAVPAPTSVILSSNTPNPVRPFESIVTLTCIVHMELGPAVDVPVILTTEWTGPDGFIATNTLQPETTAPYTSRVMFSSFGREKSGIYTCAAILGSSSTNHYLINSSTASESTRVTTGERHGKFVLITLVTMHVYLQVFT